MPVAVLGENPGDALQEEEHCRNAEVPSLEYAALVQNMIFRYNSFHLQTVSLSSN